MSSIPQNHSDEKALIDCVQRFFSKHHIGKLLARCNGMKEKGVSPVSLFRYKLSNIFVGRSMYMQQQTGSFKEAFSKNTFYRFLNSAKTNWLRFTSLLAADIVNHDIKGLTNDSRKNVFIIDDSLFNRTSCKKTELGSKVFDHTDMRFKKGFRMLTLSWSDGNTGFDLNVSFYMVRNEDKQVFWNMTFGTSYNKNKLLKLSEAVKEQMNELRSRQSSGMYYVYEEGNSVDAIYAVPTVGVDPSTGQLVYLYKDGTQSYKYDVSQRVVCGDRMPKLDGRLNTSFSWRGFSVYAGFTIRTGGQQYNQTYANKIENVNLAFNVDRRVSSERWMNPGDEAIFSGLDYKNYYMTDRYIQDESTFECNNISVTYDFRQKWVQQAGFSRLALTASIGNVFHWSTIKQERGTSYPFAIQPSFGISCSF